MARVFLARHLKQLVMLPKTRRRQTEYSNSSEFAAYTEMELRFGDFTPSPTLDKIDLRKEAYMDGVRQLIEDYRFCWEGVIRGELPLSALDGFFNVHAFEGGNVRNASLRAVDVQSQGQHLSLATVNWELTRADGSLERAWRHYYTILAGSPKPTIVVSAFQMGS